MKPLLGFFWLCVMFAACFSFVHITLSVLGSVKPKPAKKEIAASNSPEPEKVKQKKTAPEKEQPQKAPEPVYYIVEKATRKKSKYSTPKRIKFE